MAKFFETYEEARTYRDMMNMNGHALELYSRDPDPRHPGALEWAVAEYRTDELDYENNLWEMVSLELEALLEDILESERPTGDDLNNVCDENEPFWRRPS